MLKPQKFYPATIIICFILLTVFVAMVLNGISIINPSITDLLNWGALFAPFVEKGEWWRLISSSFLHFGIIHLSVNVISLFVLGREFELRYGSFLFLLLYISGIVVSAAGSLYWNLFSVTTGASGAIMAIAGAQMMGLLLVNDFDRKSRIVAFTHLFFGVLLNVLLGFYIKFIDNYAHISGILWGVSFGLIAFPGRVKTIFQQSVRVLAVVLMCISLLFILAINPTPYRYWYYTMFNSFISNDAQTVELLNSNARPEDPLVSMAGIKEASDVWQKNLDMLRLFDSPPKELKPDISILTDVFHLRNSSLDFMKKYITTGDLVFIDSIQIRNEEIKNLPPLTYWLSFENHALKNDSSNHDAPTFPVTIWYDSSWTVTSKEHAVFYREGNQDEFGNTQGKVTDYYLSGQIQMKGTYFNNLENGIFFYYNENGTYSSYGNYELGRKTGEWIYLSNEGRKLNETTYTDNSELVKNSWDLEGIPGVINGEGVMSNFYDDGVLFEKGMITNGQKSGEWRGFTEKSLPYYLEKYLNGDIVVGESFDTSGNQYLYHSITEYPIPIGGDSLLKKYLAEHITYPAKAKEINLHRDAVIELTVDGNGVLLNVEPLTRIGYGCDEEALKVLRHWRGFNGGKFRGQPATLKRYVFVAFPPENNLK